MSLKKRERCENRERQAAMKEEVSMKQRAVPRSNVLAAIAARSVEQCRNYWRKKERETLQEEARETDRARAR